MNFYTEDEISIDKFPDFDKFHPKRRVAIAVDGSESAIKSLKYAIENVFRKDDAIFVLNAVKTSNFEAFKSEEEAKGLKIQNTEKAAFAVKKSLELLKDFDKKHGLVLTGKDEREILLNALETLEPNFFVVGSRGLGAVKRVVLGSVSSYLVHHTKCPIIVVK
ncbi:hypothetical protein MHBO_000201 [Bonamia ostreae]|uniref:UspA domain-containing protein n=1 Tax=Bonamia ostreae TaxID=126728 RepID=A0ABV2AET0_9EUKA